MSFAGFPEEQQVVGLLQKSLERGRLAHSYLFVGHSLGELENMARTLAKTLNCRPAVRRGQTGLALDSCDQCQSCRKIDEENHADIHWVRPESKSRVITIDQIRDLMQTIFLKPTEADHKVAVIVAADRLNVQAANAFLKTLEEPPARSVLILLSTEPERILETILSRCLRLAFASEGRMALDEAQQRWIARFSEMASFEQKGLLSRYRLLSVLLTELAEIKGQTEKTLSQQSPLERYDDVEPKLRERWEDELSAAIEAEYRRRRGELLLTLQWWLRDVWLSTMRASEDLLAFQNLKDIAQVVARRITAEEALDNLDTVEQAQRLLNTNVQEALALEVSLLKLRL